MNEEAQKRIAECKRTKAKWLVLNALKLTEIPAEINELIWLEVLSFQSNQISEIKGIEKLTALTELNLSSNQISEIKGLEKLTNLTYLNLHSNQISEIKGLEKLTALKRLNLRSNQINEIKGLGKLTALKILAFDSNQISEIKGLDNLRNLEELYLETNDIEEIKGLDNLTALNELYLEFNQINEIRGLELLTALDTLYLSSNEIDEIKGLEKLTSLNTLYIKKNKISEIKGLEKLKQLKSLDLQDNKIKDISKAKKYLIEGNLEIVLNSHFYSYLGGGINLYGNPIKNPPIEFVKQGKQAILDYFENKTNEAGKKEVDYIYEAKLLLVGEERAGKSTIGEILSDPAVKFKEGKKSTEGIDIFKWEIPATESQLAQDFTFNIWDFGGQDIYHSTHQYFLTRRSFYLFITEARKDLRFDEFNYWLHIINTLAPDCPILVVQNKADKPHKIQDIDKYTKDFESIRHPKIIDISCDNTSDKWEPVYKAKLEDLKQIIYQVIKDGQLPGFGGELPKKWVDVRRALKTMEDKNIDHIPYAEYVQICKQHHLNDSSVKTLRNYFNDIGVFTYFDDIDLSNTIFLNHEYVTDALYKVLENEQIQNKNGQFKRNDLKDIWKDEKYKDKLSQLYRLLIHSRFKICYECADGTCMIPSHFITSAKKVDWKNENDLLQFRFNFNFMPKGIMGRLIVSMSSYIHKETYWQFGVLLKYNDAVALVTEVHIENKNNITIAIEGEDRTAFLHVLIKEIVELCAVFPNLNYEKEYACICSECKGAEKKYYHSEHSIKKAREKNKPTVECKTSLDDVKVLELLGMYGFSKEEQSIHDRFDNLERKTEELKGVMYNTTGDLKNQIQKLNDQQSKDLIQFLTLAFTALDEAQIDNYEVHVEELKGVKKMSSLENKVNLSLPILEFVAPYIQEMIDVEALKAMGINPKLDIKYNLKPIMNNISQLKDKLALKYGIQKPLF